MGLDQLFASWESARATGDEQAANACIRAARQLASSGDRTGWDWLNASLDDDDRKWFVAKVFECQPVPRSLMSKMLHTAVLEKDPSFNRVFLDPSVQSFGATVVLSELLTYFKSGTDEEKAGSASALYWVRRESGGDRGDELRDQIQSQMLREFVNNQDVEVRRRIIPMLALKESRYESEDRPLLAQAISIARAHPDEYIRHRVEIQLGSPGPFMAVPMTSGLK